MISFYDDTRPTNSGLPVPDAPEPIECMDDFREDYCKGCSDYDECKRIYEEMYG